jgi:hypothetical protein
MAALPRAATGVRISRRVAGVGSLGRPRFVAIAESAGGLVARKRKPGRRRRRRGCSRRTAPMPPAACCRRSSAPSIRGSRFAGRGSSAAGAGLLEDRGRRSAGKRDEHKLLRAMGWETANVHGYNSARRVAIARDVSARKNGWLLAAASAMVDATIEDWRVWKRQGRST